MSGTNSDLTFITNEPGHSLLQRFETLIKDTQNFDALVGYFYTSGFFSLYKQLENTEKIRILVGIKTDQKIAQSVQQVQESLDLQFSHKQAKDNFGEQVKDELLEAEDKHEVELGILKFIEWIRSKKLEIKAYPSNNVHSKLYIMTFKEGDRDVGRVITGSSNFTQAGLVDNLEFNVELKNPNDYEFALKKFNEMWRISVDVSDKYIETVEQNTWLNNAITPYQLYLKFLYEYFRDDLSSTDEVLYKFLPADFLKLSYQEQAVINAKKILDEYGGVFISDVVGLGKTYISAILASQLQDGRTLVLAPPVLLDKNNPGSWRNVFLEFNVPAEFESVGQLESLIQRGGLEKYKNVFIDEAHNFRTESNITYEHLSQICRGKRVILVTATPYNNNLRDILSQIKLFQPGKKSTIPNLPNIDGFISNLEKKLQGLDRQKDYNKFIEVVRLNAVEVREQLLKYLMVRRTRAEVEKYFAKDLEEQGLKFPEVANPRAIFYQLNKDEDEIFNRTIELVSKKFKYSRYIPMAYYTGDLSKVEEQAQRNIRSFMKVLLIKRLESSFYAFKLTLDRFIHTYEQFIGEYNNGSVYVSKKYSSKIFELLENDDDETIQKLIDEDKARVYPIKDFDKKFIGDLETDYETLKEIRHLWKRIDRDPKILEFINKLKTDDILKNHKLIIFTESKETAEYLHKNISSLNLGKSLLFHGGSGSPTRDKVIANFDAKARNPSDEYRILISTEVLAEGVNLHQANTVINYDIPWNPTRLMQRVGRINRVDTKFDIIYTYNFFPTIQGNDEIKLKEAAVAKIFAFIEMLGTDARLLTDGEEIKSFDLFEKLTAKQTITGENEAELSDLKFLKVIKDIRDQDPDLFEKIKYLPKKARTARKTDKVENNSLLTYFRKGKLQKFFQSKVDSSEELDFITAANMLEASIETQKENLDKDFYLLLDKNKEAFILATTEEIIDNSKSGHDNSEKLLKYLKAIRDYRRYTDEQVDYLKLVMDRLLMGSIPKQTTKNALREIKNLGDKATPLTILATLQINIPNELLISHLTESTAQTSGPREVILSEYLLHN